MNATIDELVDFLQWVRAQSAELQRVSTRSLALSYYLSKQPPPLSPEDQLAHAGASLEAAMDDALFNWGPSLRWQFDRTTLRPVGNVIEGVISPPGRVEERIWFRIPKVDWYAPCTGYALNNIRAQVALAERDLAFVPEALLGTALKKAHASLKPRPAMPVGGGEPES